jgi:hypothetical protein
MNVLLTIKKQSINLIAKHHIHLSTLHQHRKIMIIIDYIEIEGTRFGSEISHTRTDLTA